MQILAAVLLLSCVLSATAARSLQQMPSVPFRTVGTYGGTYGMYGSGMYGGYGYGAMAPGGCSNFSFLAILF